MAISVYEVGESVHLTATFSDSPEWVTCKVKLPTGAVVNLTVLTAEDGSCSATVSAEVAGMYFYRWSCPGAAEEGQFSVSKSRVI